MDLIGFFIFNRNKEFCTYWIREGYVGGSIRGVIQGIQEGHRDKEGDLV